MLTLLLLEVLVLFNTINGEINTTTVTTITTMPKGMKVKFSRNFEGEGELSQNTLLYAFCQKGVPGAVYILRTVWWYETETNGLL